MKQSLVQNAFRCKGTNIFPFRKCFSKKPFFKQPPKMRPSKMKADRTVS